MITYTLGTSSSAWCEWIQYSLGEQVPSLEDVHSCEVRIRIQLHESHLAFVHSSAPNTCVIFHQLDLLLMVLTASTLRTKQVGSNALYAPVFVSAQITIL